MTRNQLVHLFRILSPTFSSIIKNAPSSLALYSDSQLHNQKRVGQPSVPATSKIQAAQPGPTVFGYARINLEIGRCLQSYVCPWLQGLGSFAMSLTILTLILQLNNGLNGLNGLNESPSAAA